MENFLNTTLRNIAWFKNAYERKELEMKPPFQRNPVWVTRQKSFLSANKELSHMKKRKNILTYTKPMIMV